MSTWREAQHHELEVWERIASSYESVLAELSEVASLAGFVPQSDVESVSVIDIGVGPLGMSLGALIGARRVVGVDPLPRLRAHTGVDSVDKLVSELQGQVDYLQADASSALPLPPGEFDLVICDNVIDHTQDPGAVLRECRRVISPGGHFIFGVNVFSLIGIIKWRYFVRRFRPGSENVLCHPYSFREGAVRTLLEQEGWIIAQDSHAPIWKKIAGRSYRYRVVAVADGI